MPTGAGDRWEAADRARWATCRQLARELLLIGPGNEDLKRKYLDVLIDNGLPDAANPKRVLIVGAGIAGLVAGQLLKQAGHDVIIIEANANRVGGRIKTFHADAQASPPFVDPRLYAEAGAMRLPSFHPLTLALVDKLGLARRLFYNVDIDPDASDLRPQLWPVRYQPFDGSPEWRYGDDRPDFRVPRQRNNTWLRTNGTQVRRRGYSADPARINRGFGLAGSELEQTALQMANAALEKVRDYYSTVTDAGRVNKPFDEWVEGWARVIYDFDGYSMGRFLREVAKLSDGAIEAIGTIENMTSRLHLSFFHSFLGRSDIRPDATYWEIEGGTWKLTDALHKMLVSEIHLGERVVHLEYWDPDRDCIECELVGPDGPAVAIRTESETDPGETAVFTGDVAIVTIPFSSLRFATVQPPFSYKKRRAIIEMHYDQATKVLLEFSRRWWEFTEEHWKRELDAIDPALYDFYRLGGREDAVPPAQLERIKALTSEPGGLMGAHESVDDTQIDAEQREEYGRLRPITKTQQDATHAFGGGSTTDNVSRYMYYPSHPVPGSDGGVVLASYSWSDDAARWDSMDDAERYVVALRGTQALHGRRIEVFYTGGGQTQSWLRNPYAFGEAAVLTPHQMTSFHLDVPKPEGRVYFAGEHVSLKHAWIEGAVETAVRAALDVNALGPEARS